MLQKDGLVPVIGGTVSTTIWFVTNRNYAGKTFGTTFPKIPGDLRVGRAEVMDGGTIDGLNVFPNNPKKGSLAMFDELRGDMKTCGRDTIIYIHGFNNDFNESLQEGAELSRALGDRYNVVVFSWPSNGTKLGYYPDRHDAELSGLGFARGLLKFKAFISELTKEDACERKLHLVAHSMGNYVLRHALQKMKQIEGYASTPRLFDQVVLAAADEDADALRLDYKLANLPNLCGRLNVYFNNGDVALAVSDKVKGNPDRLGHDGPDKPWDIAQKIVLIDASQTVSGDIDMQHAYIRKDRNVIDDLTRVLAGTPSQNFGASRKYVDHANKFEIV
ncbi:MAG: alpha/beta fold hydrolase [Patescibacteria group bacterium]